MVALALLAPGALADTRGFAWDYPAAQVSNIDGFKFYCGTAAGQWEPAPKATIPPTIQTTTITIPPGATWFCVVRAYKAADESGPSNEISVVGRPDTPSNLRLVTTQSFRWDPARQAWVAYQTLSVIEPE
jgi:hypothetical protein